MTPIGQAHEIAAASQNKQGQIAGSREGDGFLNLTGRLGFDEETGWTSNAEGGQRG